MAADEKGVAELTVQTYTDVVGPQLPMLGPLKDGGTLIAHTVPGCWGPMITPEMRSGHEVTQPVAVVGAEVGDAVALAIRRITVRSLATASGCDTPVEGRFLGDPAVAAMCPACQKVNPESYLKGIGARAVRCRVCDAEITPFSVPNGYTILFDEQRSVGITVDRTTAEQIARDRADYSGIWPGAHQHSVLVLALGDLPGIISRVRPMIGNIGTTPAITMPSSRNAGDAGQRLVGAPHGLSISPDQLALRTDAHMDIDSVREGTVVICPVKVSGAGIYVGDAHAMQGDGEIAGHTTDIAAEIELQVSLIKGLGIDGPVLLPPVEDLPPLARPFSPTELARAKEMAQTMGLEVETEVAPVQVVGTGADLMAAVRNGLDRLAKLADASVDEVRNRVTLTGGVEIGRSPGVVQVTATLPLARLDRLGIGDLYRRQYDG